MSITSDIKEFALDLGYSWAGVTNTLGFPDYLTELKNRYEIYTWYIEGGGEPLTGAADPEGQAPDWYTG
jgi:epoxyqueuosine reductase